MRWKHLDWVHACWMSCCVFVLYACFAADLLWGKVDVSIFGRLEASELPWVMVLFASWSAASLPSTSLWVGTHLMCMFSLGSFLFMWIMALWNLSMIWCPGEGSVHERAKMRALLSMYMIMVLACGSLRMRLVASSMLVALPSYTIWCDVEPNL